MDLQNISFDVHLRSAHIIIIIPMEINRFVATTITAQKSALYILWISIRADGRMGDKCHSASVDWRTNIHIAIRSSLDGQRIKAESDILNAEWCDVDIGLGAVSMYWFIEVTQWLKMRKNEWIDRMYMVYTNSPALRYMFCIESLSQKPDVICVLGINLISDTQLQSENSALETVKYRWALPRTSPFDTYFSFRFKSKVKNALSIWFCASVCVCWVYACFSPQTYHTHIWTKALWCFFSSKCVYHP